MKTLLIAALAIAGVFAFAPQAEAGQYTRYVAGYDRCGNPIIAYGHKSQVWGPSYNQARYYHVPQPRYYRAPSYTTRTYRAPVCNTRSGFRISFGF
jgi:hypothetical protein